MSNAEVMEKVRTGYRMGVPSGCPLPLYNIMLDCWNEDPAKRPSFDSLKWKLKGFHVLTENRGENKIRSWELKKIEIIDPRDRPTVTASSDHYFCTWCSSNLTFQNLAEKQPSSKNSDCYWRDRGSGRVDHWWHSCLGFLLHFNAIFPILYIHFSITHQSIFFSIASIFNFAASFQVPKLRFSSPKRLTT